MKRCNEDPSIHGILVQLPLPKHIDEQIVLDSINPVKDVDGFHPVNAGTLSQGGGPNSLHSKRGQKICDFYNVELGGKNTVMMVGLILLELNGTTTRAGKLYSYSVSFKNTTYNH